jgi:hypothetical protein
VPPEASITNLAHVIQLAVAPVFLLSGVGAILSVLIARLGRIVDRMRVLHGRLADGEESKRKDIDVEIANLSSRTRFINWAISLCTICALLICAVIAALFIGALAEVSVSGAIALMFIAAMLALIIGLLSFLREIYLAADSAYLSSR